VLASVADGLKHMLQLSGMSTLMQATLLNSDPNTLLSACSITIKVCPNTNELLLEFTFLFYQFVSSNFHVR